MPFPAEIERRAWVRQGGRCAACCKPLVLENREGGERGAWHAHHRRPERRHGTNTLANCAILCINPPQECHWNIGHGGISWEHYEPLDNTKLRCLHVYAGKRTQRRRGATKRTKRRKTVATLGRIRR